MAVVSLLSGQLTRAYAQPATLSNPYEAGGGDVVEAANVLLGASDSAGSIYRYFRVPANARLDSLRIMNDANTAGTSYKFGVYKIGDPGSTGGVVPVANADLIFASVISIATARTVPTEILSPSILNAGGSAANITLRIWELLGLTADPQTMYDIGMAAVTAGSAGGNVSLSMSYTL